ncbi:DNA-protecting protein DprA [Staphylococcus argensis]|uniref:DNA-protecting protein DprA n=2 Tax=Staphylococcus argensis TaxID=1607738 RepID=A0A2K4FG86_9STAP|nr:DNA-protecting protein DprA [Staphylococcus argensis]
MIKQLLSVYPDFPKLSFQEQLTLLNEEQVLSKRSHKEEYKARYIRLTEDYMLTKLAEWQVNVLSINDAEYPQSLKEIYDPPYILFYRGNLHMLNHPRKLAIIGSRSATHYTSQTLQTFFPHFDRADLTIVSGLAKGADHIAHRLSLSYNMPSIAVLGFGHLYHYPYETQNTRDLLEREGLSLSEYPPDTRPQRYYFPQRNRLISGLAQGVFVTEAEQNSGTHITTTAALDQNREVYILPGSIFNPMTRGNMLSAQDGAKIVLEPSDIISDFEIY